MTYTTEDNLREALHFAIGLLDSYQMDIRAKGLDKEGFCQGVIYLEAKETIRRIAEGKTSGPQRTTITL